MDQGFLACDLRTGEVHRIEGPAAALVGRITAGDPGVDPNDPVFVALVDAGIVSGAQRDTHSGLSLLSRRRMIAAASAVGITTILLPHAAAASSEVGGAGGGGGAVDTEGAVSITGATFLFSQVSGSQFGFNWVRATEDADNAFNYEVTVTAVSVPPGQTAPTVNPFTFGPYTSTTPGSTVTTNRQVEFLDAMYGGERPNYNTISGTVFTATFRSITTPQSIKTINLDSQSGTGAW
jgi:hypothetical protein